MEINKFISMVLDELQDLKTNNNKKRYLVQDLEFELAVTINKEGNGKLEVSKSIMGFEFKVGVGGDVSKESIQMVKIKLKPIGQSSAGKQITINT
jgi:hypothetical protein